MFENILKWYNMGLWSKDQVHDALIKNVITQEEFDQIISK